MPHILIVNQHGENRGDEAAMRAMLASFCEQLPGTTFTLLYQFRDPDLRLSFREQVEDLPIVLPLRDYLRALLYTPMKRIGWDARWLLPASMRSIVRAYERADLVVSAPGGPYFGDIYINHEIVHWWYIYLAYLFRKPVFLYATSAGPFKKRWMNPVRRRMYPLFDRLVTREELSADYLRDLLGADTSIEVTADSAIQAAFGALPREEFFTGARAALAQRCVVAVSLNDFRYPDSDNVAASKQRYNDAMLQLLNHIAARVDAHFLFLPQLYGKVHDDTPYLASIARQLSNSASWEIVDPALDSDMQRSLFAMSDIFLASRYHPAIFGSTACVPGICIYYEHKALGFMRQLGLERCAFDINNLDVAQLCGAVDEILERREELGAHLRHIVPSLQERSARTTQMAVDCLQQSQSSSKQLDATRSGQARP